MSKRNRDEESDMLMEESLGTRSAKRKALDILAEDKAKSDAVAQKRVVAKKLRADVDDLAGLFGQMKASNGAAGMDMDGQGRRRRRRHTRKHKKSKKSKKTRKH